MLGEHRCKMPPRVFGESEFVPLNRFDLVSTRCWNGSFERLDVFDWRLIFGNGNVEIYDPTISGPFRDVAGCDEWLDHVRSLNLPDQGSNPPVAFPELLASETSNGPSKCSRLEMRSLGFHATAEL